MRTVPRHGSSWLTSAGRLVATAVALGGLSFVALSPSLAVAATSPTTVSDVTTAKNAKLGTILVSGNTLYTLKAGKHCTGKCLKVWLPAELAGGVSAAAAGPGVDAAKLGTVAAADGNLQVTYAGKPLFWFTKDKGPGQVHGNVTDKWGKWSVVLVGKSSSGTKNTNSGTGGTAF
jgi:predicted lipoprotein with Yx(FWY)xxD motif